MMGETTIEWTVTRNDDGTLSPGYTFNPWIGCTRVSDGCKHCYAERLIEKRYGRVKWGPQGKRVRTSDDNWRKPLKWNRAAKRMGQRRKVFCASLADIFEDKPDQPEMDEWRYDLLHLIADTPHLDWLLLTKRPENVVHMVAYAADRHGNPWRDGLPANVWVGVSIENQEQANRRIPELFKIPADIRFLSMEPLLGPVDLTEIEVSLDGGFDALNPTYWEDIYEGWCASSPDGEEDFYEWFNLHHEEGDPPPSGIMHPTIDWVIVGGESGPNARPMHPEWARSICGQCQEASVPFFFKQWGEWIPISNDVGDVAARQQNKGRHWTRESFYYLFDETLVKVGKKAAGRLLDGVEWNQMPTTAAPMTGLPLFEEMP